MKKIILLILFISICNCLFLPQQASAQDTIKTKEKRKNNAIKGIIGIYPFYLSGIASLGYERFISSNSSLNLTFNEYKSSGENSDTFIFSIISGYNYFFSSKYKFINNCWLNPYLIYYNTSKGFSDGSYIINNYGLGISTGKRIYFSNKKRLVLDIGFGASYSKAIYKYYENSYLKWNPSTMQYEYITITSHDPTYSWFPRPILLLGYKF